jgi:N-acetylneuraminate synthase
MYPTPPEKVRLGALGDMAAAFPDAVLGLSDHTTSIYACLGAVALGADVLERHFTSDLSWSGPDIPISSTPEEFTRLIEGADVLGRARGGHKDVLPEEQPTIDFAYASVVTTAAVRTGEVLTVDNIWVKRPGTGELHARHYDEVLGRVAARDLAEGAQVAWSDLATA